MINESHIETFAGNQAQVEQMKAMTFKVNEILKGFSGGQPVVG